MPLEVVDARTGASVPAALRKHPGWDRPELAADIRRVRKVLDEVRDQGDAAVVRYSNLVYGSDLAVGDLAVSRADISAGASRTDSGIRDALAMAADNIRSFHEAQKPQAWSIDRDGAEVGQVFRPIGRVGVHAPAGAKPLPSSMLMTVIPAQVAGVTDIAVCCPSGPEGGPPDVMLAAAELCGIDEVYRMGGAHAIGAFAYGTQTVPACDKVCGPGGLYTTLAKRELYGTVGVDGLFGPSESVVVADRDADPTFVAAELLKQAEHAPDAGAVLITTSEGVLSETLKVTEAKLQTFQTADVIRESMATHGLAVLVADLDQAVAVVNDLAPEHLCVHTTDPRAFIEGVTCGGTILLGAGTPAAMSDYCAGPSHVLPTSRAARFSSGLGVRDFCVSINVVSYTSEALEREAPVAVTIAGAEGLPAHRDGIRVRLEEK